MNIDGHGQIAAFYTLLVRGLSGACRALLLLALVALLLLASACGIRATFDDLDEDEDGVLLDDDCAPKDGSTGSVPIYADEDGDNHGVPPQIGMGCDGDPGVSVVADDCDDQNNHIWEYSIWYLDNDRDGYGVEPGVELCASEAAGYSEVAGDCLDDDPGAWPGAPTSCDGDDNDCDGQTDEDCELPGGVISGSDADWLIQGAEGSQIGASIGPAGDVDCDGLDDAVLGAPGAGDGDGAVVLAYGSSGELRWTFGEESPRVAQIAGVAKGGGFGASVAGDADFDGDGCADLVVGAPWAGDTSVLGRGLAPGGGLGSTTPGGALYLITGPWIPAQAEVSELIGVGQIPGPEEGSLGSSVTCGGDFYGDGYADCLAGAPRYSDDATPNEAGAVYLLNPPLLVGAASEIAELVVTGTTRGERLGSAVAYGDLDADGVADLVLGAPTDFQSARESEELHPTSVGRVYVVLGVPGGAYDVEGLSDTWIEGEILDTTGVSVASGGDLDGDGTHDLAVGAPEYNEGEAESVGRLATYSGAMLSSTDAPLSVEAATAVIVGQEASGELGTSVALIPDLTGDDRAELLVGAPGSDDARGAASLYVDVLSGQVGEDAVWLRVEGDGGDDQLGRSVATTDLTGLGLSDLLVGGASAPFEEDMPPRAGVAAAIFMDAW